MPARLKKAAATMSVAVAATAIAIGASSTASAIELVDVKPPIVEASTSGSTIDLEITNPHGLLDTVGCNAMVVKATSVPGVLANPLTLLDAGVVVFPSFSDITSLFGVVGGQTKTYSQTVAPGLYAVIGACMSPLNVGELPTISTPKLLPVIGSGSGGNGSSDFPSFGS
ncbi:hypothetical protein ABH922_003318 [Rhodococcus sp. 27YEA15]|uniref:hypothetical protein n=1 Tax=Rhodococcus sp. 27YEA15 TaxID=3156259 RepID=UPI003C7E2A99